MRWQPVIRLSLVICLSIVAACASGSEPSSDSAQADTTAVETPATTIEQPESTAGETTAPATTASADDSTTTSTIAAEVPSFDIFEVLDREPMMLLNIIPPTPPGAFLPLPPGMADFDEVFTVEGAARWGDAREHVDVFKIHSWQVRHHMSDDQVVAMVEFLDAHDIPLMFETEPLQPPTECDHTESFEGPWDLEMAQRIADLGGTIHAVAIEEPYHFAHKLTGPGSCQYSVERIVDEVVDYREQMRAIFPGVPFGSIEPIWEYPVATTPDDMAIWLDAYAEQSGEPFSFLHIDPDYYRDDWAEVAAGIERVADERGVRFGVLYNGGRETGSVEWMQALAENAAILEVGHGVTPQHVAVQSWVTEPEFALPDDDPSTLTGGVVRYFGERTRLSTVEAVPRAARLTDGSGSPVGGAPVEVSRLSTDGSFATVTITGEVPAGTTEAVVLLRSNFEGAGPGVVAARITNISYREGDAVSDPSSPNLIPNGSFDLGMEGWAPYTLVGAPAVAVTIDGGDGDSWLALEGSSSQQILIDGPVLAVTAGEPYAFSATFGTIDEAAGSTEIGIEFLEQGRWVIPVEPAWTSLGEFTTDADGMVVMEDESPAATLRFDFDGDLHTWPSTLTFTPS